MNEIYLIVGVIGFATAIVVVVASLKRDHALEEALGEVATLNQNVNVLLSAMQGKHIDDDDDDDDEGCEEVAEDMHEKLSKPEGGKCVVEAHVRVRGNTSFTVGPYQRKLCTGIYDTREQLVEASMVWYEKYGKYTEVAKRVGVSNPTARSIILGELEKAA